MAHGDVTFVKWVEPRERAFTVDVPQGWRVSGGVNWTGPIDAQGFVRAQSPDGKVQIFVGDPEILPRQVPGPYSSLQTGAAEGAEFRSPSGGRALMQRFLSGSQYAKQHVMWRLCRNPRWVTENDLPDLSRSISASLEPQARSWGGSATADAGDVGFLCDNAQGYVFATTVLGSMTNGVMQSWSVLKLAGFLSVDPMQSMQARYITEHMLATFALDPGWERAYENRVRQAVGGVISMQNAALAVQQRASQSASTTLARLNHPNPGVNVRPGERRPTSVNTTLGTKDVCDAIGRCKNVSNDAESLFMDHSGNVRAGRPGGAPPDNSGVWSPTYVR